MGQNDAELAEDFGDGGGAVGVGGPDEHQTFGFRIVDADSSECEVFF